MSYPYAPELTVSDQLSKIDLFDPRLRPVVTALRKQQQAAARAFAAVEDVAGVPCYVLGEGREAMLYCHGGAFLLPVQVSALQLAKFYAESLKMRVIVPEYRLLPSHRAPAAWEDCKAVAQAVRPQLVYGESAGGALAVDAAAGAGARGLMLVYPCLDPAEDYPSKRLYTNAAWPGKSDTAMWQEVLCELPPDGRSRCIPMERTDLSALPGTVIEAEEIDVLRDEASAFVKKLRENGVPVTETVNRGAYHGFDTELENPYVQRVLQNRLTALGKMLNGGIGACRS